MIVNGSSNRNILMLFSLLLISFLIVSNSTMAFAQEGRISVPQNQYHVDGVYEVRGTVSGLPAGSVLWIAVRKGNNFWPKDQAFIVGGNRWTANVDEPTKPGGRYSLVLFSVDKEGQAQIADWYRINEELQRWPAMVGGIKGATALDSIDVRRR